MCRDTQKECEMVNYYIHIYIYIVSGEINESKVHEMTLKLLSTLFTGHLLLFGLDIKQLCLSHQSNQ